MYIHDYLVKRDMKATAQAFQAEGKVSSEPVGECFWMFFFHLFGSIWSGIVPFVHVDIDFRVVGYSYRCAWRLSFRMVVGFLGYIHC